MRGRAYTVEANVCSDLVKVNNKSTNLYSPSRTDYVLVLQDSQRNLILNIKKTCKKMSFSNYYNQESLSGLDTVFGKARLGKYLVTLKEIIDLKETMIDLE